MDAHRFLQALAVVLCTAGVTTVIFQRLRQPVVLGYILAGFIVGPHVPIPLIADRQIVHTLSELGVILLMFSLGLEFSIRKLFRVGPTAGLTAVIQSSIMVWLGFIVGRSFGWSARESIFTGAIVAISSTTIIAKAFDERGIKGRLRELVVGVLIVEDMIAILLIALLTALSQGDGLSAETLLRSSARLVAFLAALVIVGLLVVPRMVRYVTRLRRAETTLVASIGLCFAVALLAQEIGYSVALGAFLAGSLVAESGEEKGIEHLVMPVRDMFAAIFFVSVGLMIDPVLIVQHWTAVLALTLVVVVGKLFGVGLGAFLTGNGIRTSVQAGLSLAQIGEFSFIIAGLGLTLDATGPFLYPIAVAVSAITTLTTPFLIRTAGPVAAFMEDKLPKPLQTFAALYGTWFEQLRAAPSAKSAGVSARRMVKLLLFDMTLIAALVIGAALATDNIAAFARQQLGFTPRRTWIIGAAFLASMPFVIGIFRTARRLGVSLAEAALPSAGAGKVDLAATPRRALVVTLQLAVVLLAGLPLLALTQPFVPGWSAPLTLAMLLLVLGVAFWRGATNLQGHVKAGAQLIVEALVTQARRGAVEPDDLEQVRALLPGLGDPVPVRLKPDSAAVGKTLAELHVRGLTGASVLAIARGEEGAIFPTPGEVLRAGDVLALAGTQDAVRAARELLLNGAR